MSTPSSNELLSAYLDGELTPREKEDLERRLEQTPALREQLEDLAEVSRRVRSLPPPLAVPAGFRDEVLLQIQQKSLARAALSRPPYRPLSRFRWAAAAVAVALVVVAVDFARNGREGPERLPLAEQQRQGLDPADPGMFHMPSPDDAPALRPWRDGETAPVKVVGLNQAQIQQKLAEIGRAPVPGEAHFFLNQSEGVPLLVEFTVVDVLDSMNQVQVLVRKQAVHALSGQPVVTSLDDSPSDQLTAVYLELDENQMAELLHDVPALDAVAYVDTTLADELEDLSRSAERFLAEQDADLHEALPGAGERPRETPPVPPEDSADAVVDESPTVQNFDFDLVVRNSEVTVQRRRQRSAAGNREELSSRSGEERPQPPPAVPLPRFRPAEESAEESADVSAPSPVTPGADGAVQEPQSGRGTIELGLRSGQNSQPQGRVRAILLFRQQQDLPPLTPRP